MILVIACVASTVVRQYCSLVQPGAVLSAVVSAFVEKGGYLTFEELHFAIAEMTLDSVLAAAYHLLLLLEACSCSLSVITT